jgi:hypothetical protein
MAGGRRENDPDRRLEAREPRVGRRSDIAVAGPNILAAIRSGADRRSASECAGVPYGTLRSWLSRGRRSLEPFATFAKEFEAAEAEAAVRMAQVVFEAAHRRGDYRPALEWLKQRRPDQWGDRRSTDPEAVVQPQSYLILLDDKPPRTIKELSDAELALVEERLVKASEDGFRDDSGVEA